MLFLLHFLATFKNMKNFEALTEDINFYKNYANHCKYNVANLQNCTFLNYKLTISTSFGSFRVKHRANLLLHGPMEHRKKCRVFVNYSFKQSLKQYSDGLTAASRSATSVQ